MFEASVAQALGKMLRQHDRGQMDRSTRGLGMIDASQTGIFHGRDAALRIDDRAWVVLRAHPACANRVKKRHAIGAKANR
jgi:hypothetical protein